MSPALGPVGFASGSPWYLGGEEVRSRPYAVDGTDIDELLGPRPRIAVS